MLLFIWSAYGESHYFFTVRNTTNFLSLNEHRIGITEESVRRGPLYLVTRVIDGDTLDVEKDGMPVRVRLIGIDTPETVDPRRSVGCFGREASQKASQLLLGNMVYLRQDPTQGDYDKYKRMLAYVFLPDNTLVNEKMIREGYAYEYTYRSPYAYQSEFRNAERLARNEKIGLWADGVCASQAHTP